MLAWGWRRMLMAFVAGAATTLALPPFEIWPVPFITWATRSAYDAELVHSCISDRRAVAFRSWDVQPATGTPTPVPPCATTGAANP